MSDVSSGDLFFIVLIIAVIHGIMLAIGLARRRRQTTRRGKEPENR